MFCSAFANALKGHVDDSSVSERLFSAMLETLEAGLPEFYATLNALLVRHGVLDRVEREKPNIRRQPVREVRPSADPFGRADAVGSEGAAQWSGATEFPLPRAHAELQGIGRAGVRPLGSLRDQLHLSRLFAAPGETPDNAPEYSTNELVSGLEELQNLFSRTGGSAALDPGSVRQQLLAHLQRSGAPTKSLGQSASDGLELVGSLFQSLLGDAALGAAARTHLPRLQPLLHRAALEDGALLDSTQHPLLRVVDRVAQLDATLDGTQEQRLQEILDRLGHADGAAPVESVLTELEALVESQGTVYTKAVAETVRVAEEQQRVLRERRELSGDPLPPTPAFPEELARWVDRAKALKPGARVTLNTTGRAVALTLAWVAEAHSSYLFVDGRGQKAASLTLQQVVVYLRRGLLKLVSDAPGSAVDRALFGVVDRMHRKLIEDATEDPLTGLHTRKAFMREVEARLPLPQTEPAETEGVMCEISFENLRDINERAGTEIGDELIRAMSAKLLEANPGEGCVRGRLGGGEWGLYFTRGGEKTALRSMRALMPTLEAIRLAAVPDLAPRLACGIAGVDGQSPLVEPMLRAARAAREHAARGGEGIALAGADERRRQQIAQLMAYVPKALARNRLVLMYHEIRALDISEMPAARILLAAEDRGGKLIPPALFAPAVAGTHYAFDIDLWMLRALLGWIDAMPVEADRYSAFVVPLSRVSLQTEGIAHLIVNEFMNHPVPPSRIRFEIEDAVAHANLAECAELVGSLREFGCRFVLGDFSGEHHDNAYLRELAIDFIELAPRFTVDSREDPRDVAITRSINELAHFMGRRTIARVDATPEVQRALRQMRVDYLHDTSRETRLQVNANG
jgi:diguanylate cyclase (GGDEF)-like protein